MTLITAEELFDLGEAGRCELVNGEIIHMAPAGAEHGDVALEIAYRIKTHVDAHRLGKVYAAETGFVLRRNPDVVRAPDVAFVRRERVPRGPKRGFLEGAPDLAVEVVSPSDRHSDLMAKVQQWLTGGAVSVWAVDPINRSLDVYRSGGQILRYVTGQEVADEPALPGFVLKLDELFAEESE